MILLTQEDLPIIQVKLGGWNGILPKFIDCMNTYLSKDHWDHEDVKSFRYMFKDGLNAASGAVTKRLKKVLGTNHFEDVVGQLRGISSALKE